VWNDIPENIRAQYRNEDGEVKEEGDLVTFPELANTLEAIATGGADVFYMDGTIAQSIVNTVNASGGIITLEDLQTYAVVMEEPLRAQYNGKFKGGY
jgi:gamma-glutamyltranspeptidase/glutathione hydrolase/leukotriene-C4 hydrolase